MRAVSPSYGRTEKSEHVCCKQVCRNIFELRMSSHMQDTQTEVTKCSGLVHDSTLTKQPKVAVLGEDGYRTQHELENGPGVQRWD